MLGRVNVYDDLCSTHHSSHKNKRLLVAQVGMRIEEYWPKFKDNLNTNF